MPHIRTRTAALLGAVLALGGCGLLDDQPIARRASATIATPAPAVDVDLPEDLCAALDRSLVDALVPGAEAVVPRLETEPGGDTRTDCRTEAGDGNLAVTVNEYRTAAGQMSLMADSWFEAGCFAARARVLADGLGDRSCRATSAEVDQSPRASASVSAVVANVVVDVTWTRYGSAEVAVAVGDLERLAQQALDAVPDLPEGRAPQDVPETAPRTLPADLCAGVAPALVERLVPQGTVSEARSSASGSTVASTCFIGNDEVEPEQVPRGAVRLEVISHGPALGLTADEAARAMFEESCRTSGEPGGSSLGDLECASSEDPDAGSGTEDLLVLDGSTVVSVTYVWSRPDGDGGPPTDPVRRLVTDLLALP